jgi:hypothetical protein
MAGASWPMAWGDAEGHAAGAQRQYVRTALNVAVKPVTSFLQLLSLISCRVMRLRGVVTCVVIHCYDGRWVPSASWTELWL